MVKFNLFFSLVALSTAPVVHSATTSPSLATTTSSSPSSISPSGSTSPPPASTLVQLGWKYSLNWPYVSSTPNAQKQIFTFTPIGVAYALNLSSSAVVMKSLQPLDTQSSLGYITTLALFYIPSKSATIFQNEVLDPNSQLYHQPSQSVQSLMQLINPSISTNT